MLNPAADKDTSAAPAAQPAAASACDLDRVDDLRTLDKEYDRLRKDIENILANRLKDSIKPDSRKFRMSIVPTIGAFGRYADIRENKLNAVTAVSVPLRVTTGLDTAKMEMDTLWNIQDLLRPKNRSNTLIQFFRQRILSLVQERQLLLHRASMAFQHEDTMNRHRPMILAHYESIQSSLVDAIERYDRLLMAEDAAYVRPKKGGKGNQEAAMEARKAASSRPSVEMEDVKTMAQHMCKQYRECRDYDTFLSRIANLTTSDTEELVQMARDITQEPMNCRSTLPLKNPKSDTFISDFETVLSWFNLDTSIEAEDGRALAYVTEKMFNGRFTQLKITPNPADVNSTSQTQTLGDTLINALDSQEDVRITKVQQAALKVVKATWTDMARRLFGEVRDEDMMGQKHERIDFQLRYEYDLLMSDTIGTVRDHLRVTLKYYTDDVLHHREKDFDDDGGGIASSAHASAVAPSLPPPAMDELTTKLGMLIPKSEGGIGQMTSKRQQLAELHKISDDPLATQLGEVFMSRSPDHVMSIFASHEVHTFLQLRYLKSRELRMVLLRQLNFFRSIERRLVHDLEQVSMPAEGSETLDPVGFESGSPLRELQSFARKRINDLAQAMEQHQLEKMAEDKRVIFNRQIIISNDDGGNIVYDVAYMDLKRLETRLLRIASGMINRTAKDGEDRDEYFMEHARTKLRDQRDFMDVSFTAPNIDRQQILLELYESEVQLNERKVMLVNALMELYEHVSWPDHRKLLLEHIVKVMHTPRALMETVSSSSSTSALETMFRGVAYQIKAFEAQEQLVLEIVNHAIRQQTEPEWGSFNFHHGAVVPIQPHEFLLGLGDVLKLPHQIQGFVNDLRLATVPFADIPTSTLEAAVWQYILRQWSTMSATSFVLPETPRKLLFHMDLITRQDTIETILADVYAAENSAGEALVHPLLGTLVTPAPSVDPAFQDRAMRVCVTYTELLRGYRRLKIQWLETHFLNQTLKNQAMLLGVSHKTFFPQLNPIPFDMVDSGEVHTQALDISDDDEPTARPTTSKKDPIVSSVTPLAMTEFDVSWGNVALEADLIIKQFALEGSSIVSECLRTQVLAKYTSLTLCETNQIILNRLEERYKTGEVATVYSGDFASVGFLPTPFRRPIRRQMLAMYQSEWRKIQMASANLREDKLMLKVKAYAFYSQHMSVFLLEQISRILLIKVQRQLPASVLSTINSKNAIDVSISQPGASGNAGANASSNGTGPASATDSGSQTADSVLDIEQGKYLRVWTAVLPMDALALGRVLKYSEQELSNVCSPVLPKLVQIYSLLVDLLRVAFALGDHLNERGEETVRQLLFVVKKEVLNFGSPITADKLIGYLSHRWAVLRLRLLVSLHSASYCLLTSPTLQPAMDSFFAVYNYFKRIARYPNMPGRILPCGTQIAMNFRSQALTDLSLTDRKLCSERFNEIEAYIEDIFHQTNLESLEVENAYANQIAYLKTAKCLLRLRFELLSVSNHRKPIDYHSIGPFLAIYKSKVVSDAYREFVANQRRKGSHIEDVNATRGAQMEFERCQVVALREVLTIMYTKSMMRAMKRVFDLLVDERTDALFAHRDAITLPRPYLANAYPSSLREFDFSHKSALFDELCYDLYTFSHQTTTALSQATRDRGRFLIDERPGVVDADINHNFIIRRDLFAQAISNFSTKLAQWNQIKFKEVDDYFSRMNSLSLDLLARQRNLLDTFAIEQSFIHSAYERDVRLGASIKASEIFLELSTIGSELNELKKARRVEEKLIRARVREEYEELVAELSSQIHKLKARFTEFRINSVDEVLSALSEVKRDDLLAFIGKDYHANAATTGNTIISLQETIDEIRSDNAELKQVMSKLKSMYALKSMTSKSVFTKKIARLVEEKRVAEERLWESYRESEVRERVLRKNLVKTQKELVSIQTHHEVLKRQLKEEQRSKELLQKALSMHVSENKASMEMASLRKVETFTRFEFERLLEENKKLNDESASLRLEVSRLQTVLQAQEWRLATKQRLRMSPSRPSSPSARPTHSAAASRSIGGSNPDILQSTQQSPFAQPQSPDQMLLRPTSALPVPMSADRGLQHQSLMEVSPALSSKVRPSTAKRQLTPSTVFHAKSSSSGDLIREEITLQMRDPVSPRRPMTAKRERILTMPHIGSGSRPGSGIVSRSPGSKQ